MPFSTIASGAVASGNGTGSVNATVAGRIAEGALSGSEVFTVTSGAEVLGAMSRWTIASGKQWAFQVSAGADTTVTGTVVSATGTALSVAPNDVIVVTVALNDDIDTHTSQTVTLAGATLSAMTWQTVFTDTTGSDAAMYVGHCTVTAGTVSASPVYAATASTSGESATAVTFLRLREQDPALPGLMGLYGDPMIEPESHTHNPPVIDSNGNRYRLGESTTSHDINRTLVQKSSDGGITWKASNWASHTTAQDLEGTWTLKVGTKIYFSVNRDDTVWLVIWNMSDDASPDTYGTQETIDTGLSASGVVQYSCLARLSTGDMWCFYSDLLSGANNQIGYRLRTGVNTYGSKTTISDGGNNITGPAAVVGAGDVTYLFYKDSTAGTLVYRTLTAAGSLSAATTIASGTAISTKTLPFTNAVYYDDAGVEVIGIAYIAGSAATDILKYREIRNGTLQSEETISTAAVTRDPGQTDSQAVVAHLAVDGTTVHAMWSRQADGDLMRDRRILGSGWGTDTVVWASGGQTGWYVYCDVVTVGSKVKLIYTYDQGTHVDDASNITYNELTLRTSVTLSQPSETDTAQALTRIKRVTLGQATETDTAQAVTPMQGGGGQIVAVGQASETDAGQGVGRRKLRIATQPTETDTAQPTGRLKRRTSGQPSEVDAGQTLGRVKTRMAGQPSDTETAQPVARRKAKIANQAAETDAAQAMARRKTTTTGQPAETNAAQTVTRRKVRTLGIATEADLAQAVTSSGQHVTGQATETDSALPLTGHKVRSVGQPSTVDTALTARRVKSRQLGVASTSELAQPMARRKAHLVGLAEEADAPLALVLAGPSITPRPNTGTTSRPVAGTNVRPNTGTITRPGSGTITRPFAGTTPRP